MRLLDDYKPGPAAAYALVVSATILWATAIVIGRGVRDDIPPVGLSFWRWSLASLVLLPLAWRDISRKWTIIVAHRKLIMLLGVLQIGSSTIVFLALNFTTAINATLINATQPALTVIPAWLLTRDRVTARACLGILAALAGIVVMVTRADLQILLSLGFNVGDFLVLAAIIGWSLYATLLHRLPEGLGHMTSLFLVCLTGAVMLVPFYIYETTFLRPVPFTGSAIALIVFLSVFVSVISILFWNLAIRSVGPNRATIFINLIPVFGVALAIIFLGERLFAYHMIGAGFVVVGIVLVVTRARPR